MLQVIWDITTTKVTFIFTVRKWSCGKVMFSHVSVCNSVHIGGVGTSHESWDRSHDGDTPSGMPLAPQGYPATDLGYSTTSGVPRGIPCPPEYCTYSAHQTWGPVQTCSLEDLTPPHKFWYQSVRYPSYWVFSCTIIPWGYVGNNILRCLHKNLYCRSPQR